MRTKVFMWGSVVFVAVAVATSACSGEYDEAMDSPRRDAGARGGDSARPGDAANIVDPDGATESDTGTSSSDGGSGAEICDNGFDDNRDGRIDEDCACAPGAMQTCYPRDPSEINVGVCRAGTQRCLGSSEFGVWGGCDGAVTPGTEQCGNGADDDCNGLVDDASCVCSPSMTRSCYSGPIAQVGHGRCRAGMQVCSTSGMGWSPCNGEVGPSPEVCDNRIDDDCDGMVDEGCTHICTVTVMLDGDCVTASCPTECPYPVGCDITMAGGDSRGCVASTPTGRSVYFQEGNVCGAGHVGGTLRCSSIPGAGLNAGNCRINKPTAYYPTSRSGCPT